MSTPDLASVSDLYSVARERHEEIIDGVRALSVTTIIRHAGLMRFYVPRHVLAAAADRGKSVHMIAADIDRDSPDYWTGGPLEGYARAYLAFKARHAFKPREIEQKCRSRIYFFCGIFDREGLIQADDAAIIDLKSGVEDDWHKEQTAGYTLTFSDGIKRRRFSLYLAKDGSFKLKEHKDPRDFSRFIAAITIARTREERRLINDDGDFDSIFDELQISGFEAAFGSKA